MANVVRKGRRAVLAVVRRLERQAAELARHIRAVGASELRHLPMLMEPAIVERGNRHAEAILHAFVKHMLSGRQQFGKELFRKAAIERASSGFPLEAMLHIYRTAAHEVLRWLVREVRRIRGGEDAVIELTDGCVGFINAGSAAFTEGYVRFEADRMADRDRTLREVVDDMIVGRAGGREVLQARAQSLGLDATGVMQLIVAQPVARQGEAARGLAATRELLRDTLRKPAGEVTVVVRGTDVIAVLEQGRETDSGTPEAWLSALTTAATATGIRVGVSTFCNGFADAPRGYEEARLALSVSSPTNPVVSFGDVRIFEYLLTRVDGTALRLIPGWLHQLEKPRGRADGPLPATVLAYMECGFNAGETARRLRVHPHTVLYRLRKVTKITGLNMRRFDDVLELVTVLRLAGRVGAIQPVSTS